MIKTKKGISHVEIIISFIIFTSFILFLLITLNPIKKFSKNISYLDMTESKILGHVSTNFSVTSLTLNSSFVFAATIGDCFYLNFSLPNKIIVKDESFNTITATKDNDYVYFNYTGKRFYKIYSSEELEEKALDIALCKELGKFNYTIGVTNFYKKISYSKLINLNNEYNENYEELKKNLNLKNDFNIAVRDITGYLFKAEKYKPKATEIIAKDIPIQILNKNADLVPAIMNIQVWD